MSNWNEKWPGHHEPLTILWPCHVTLHMPGCSDWGARLIKEEAMTFRKQTCLEKAQLCPPGTQVGTPRANVPQPARMPYFAKQSRLAMIPTCAGDYSVVTKSTDGIVICLRSQVLESYYLGSNPTFVTSCVTWDKLFKSQFPYCKVGLIILPTSKIMMGLNVIIAIENAYLVCNTFNKSSMNVSSYVDLSQATKHFQFNKSFLRDFIRKKEKK